MREGGGGDTRTFNNSAYELNGTVSLSGGNSAHLMNFNTGNFNLLANSTINVTTITANMNTAISGTGFGLTKGNGGTLNLNAANTYTGVTNITGGTLALGAGGSVASPSIIVGASTTFDVSGVTGGFALTSSQTISGPGTVVGAMAISGTLSPGSSPGTLTTGNQTWFNGGDYNWQVLDATGSAGTGYDSIAITGTLDLTNLTAAGFGINLWSLSSIGPDVSGNALNFDNTINRSWTLLTTSGGITGFDATDFAINVGAANGTSGFSNALDPEGSFFISQSGDNLLLNYTVVPEPGAALLGSIGLLFLLRRRRTA